MWDEPHGVELGSPIFLVFALHSSLGRGKPWNGRMPRPRLLVSDTSCVERRKGVFVKEKGTVKWFNGAKGYGFIQRSTGEDVFVHYSVIQENGYRSLNEGETVEFELVKGPKGLQAANVARAL